MSRAVSTPLDAALAVLLVSAAVAVLVGVHPPTEPAPSPDSVADVVLPVTANASCAGRTGRVRAPVGQLLAVAADAPSIRPCARRATQRALAAVVTPANVTLIAHGTPVADVGPIPRGRRVRATALRLPGGSDARVVVRTWSP